jgi:hypothetical protein
LLCGAVQVLGAVGLEVLANGIVNKRWTVPKGDDFPASDHDDAISVAATRSAYGFSNGASNGFHQNGVAPKKQL